MRISPDGGRTFPAWWTGAGRRRREVKLSPRLPNEPVTVPVYHRASGTGRMLVADFDVSLAVQMPWVADPVARVELDAAAFVALIERLGGRAVTDRSPTGGRHVYVLFARPLPWTELRDACRALKMRFPTIDDSPMAQPGGQIRVPGSAHKLIGGRLTGWMTLTMPLDDAIAAARNPCGPAVWNALLSELTGEYAALGLGGFAPAAGASGLTTLPHDDEGEPWRPRVGGALPASPYYAEIAASGTYDPSRYPSGSEARQAVLESCARRGWRLDDIRARIASGEWAGLWALYGRRNRGDAARHRALEADWRKAVQRATSLPGTGPSTPRSVGQAENPAHTGDTRPRNSRPPMGGSPTKEVGAAINLYKRCMPLQSKDLGHLNQWQLIATFQNAVWVGERDPSERRRWGRRAGSIRRVLRALMVASRLSGSTTTGFGVRYLGLIAGLDYRLVAKVLQQLRDEADPWVDHVAVHHRDEADRYALRVPDRYLEMAVWRRWRAGLIPAIHPVFRMLSSPCAFVYEALDEVPTGASQIATAAAVSSSATSYALRELAEHGLAVRVEGGWRRTLDTTLDEVAVALGADVLQEELAALYAAQREEWRALLASLEAGLREASKDPEPGQAAVLADLHAGHEPPAEHPGPADHLPDPGPGPDRPRPASARPAPAPPGPRPVPVEPDPFAWMKTPEYKAAMERPPEPDPLSRWLAVRREQREQLREIYRARAIDRWRRQKAKAKAKPPPTRLVPMPAAEMAALAAGNPALRLLIDQLGAVVLTEQAPP